MYFILYTNYNIGKPFMMYQYPKLGVRNYGECANPELLNELEAEVENYNTKDYQTPEIAALCTQILMDAGFPTVFSFDPDEQVDLQADHIRAYKQLRIAIFQFHANGGQLELLPKPQGAHKWIEAQKEVEQARIHGIEGDERVYISEVETEDSDTEQEQEQDNNEEDEEDDGLLLDI
jgi:hypothetical protein